MVAPDLYIVPGLAPRSRLDSIQTWLDGRVPSFALEIVSQDEVKDYVLAPERYDELGVRELVIPTEAEAERAARLEAEAGVARLKALLGQGTKR